MGKDEVRRYHEQLLYPVVRVHGKEGGGSGTVIYSEPDPENEGEYLTFVLTNHHVIESLIQRKEDWDGLLKRKVEKEFVAHAKVEVFTYHQMSRVVSSNAHRGELVAYDEHHDLAILRLMAPSQYPYVAKLLPRDRIKSVRVFDKITVCGCSLLHDPIARFGYISYLDELIDEKTYIMVDAGMYFGNSGGACFLAETGELLGVPSRVAVKSLGFGGDVVTWMGWVSSPSRFYEFIDQQELRFLYDSSDTYRDALKRRGACRRQALLELKAETLQHASHNRSGGSSLENVPF